MAESRRKDSKKMGRKNTNKRRQKVLHCIEYSKQMFLEVKLHGLVPHFCIHASVKDLYVYSNDWSANFALLRLRTDGGNIKIAHRYMNSCRNWEGGPAVSFLGIFVSNFRSSAFAVNPYKSN
jgi:hypothetical protein